MPRRAVLSDEQRAVLPALPDEETLLIQHWTLSQGDLAFIVRRRGRLPSRSSFARYVGSDAISLKVIGISCGQRCEKLD